MPLLVLVWAHVGESLHTFVCFLHVNRNCIEPGSRLAALFCAKTIIVYGYVVGFNVILCAVHELDSTDAARDRTHC